MEKKLKYAKYGREDAYSYTLGAFPTMELLLTRPDVVKEVLYHRDVLVSPHFEEMKSACEERHLIFREASKQVERLRDKDKCLVIGVFEKFLAKLDASAHHLVLVHPGDMGNLGTILRTALGFSFQNIALIEPCCDPYHPKAIRSSMGALFKLQLQLFPSFEDYLKDYGAEDRSFYPFMLPAKTELKNQSFEGRGPKSLIFGNESSGLDPSFIELGSPTLIGHSSEIDSLNLAMAVGIALYDFDCKVGE